MALYPLQTFEVKLRNLDGPLPIQAVRAGALNGLFYAEMNQKYSNWVDGMHKNDGNMPHPFSMSLLFADDFCQGFRIAALTTDVGERIAEVWGSLAARGAKVRLGAANMLVEGVHPGSPQATSYQELFDNTPIARGLRLYFETPVRLLSRGHSSVLPFPRLLWDGYIRRWDAFSGIPLPPEFSRWVEWQVYTTEVRLETCFTYIESTTEWKGVVGESAYHAYSDENGVPASRYHDYLRTWQALARLSEFSGSGEKVTMGMGRTHFLKAEGIISTSTYQNRVGENV